MRDRLILGALAGALAFLVAVSGLERRTPPPPPPPARMMLPARDALHAARALLDEARRTGNLGLIPRAQRMLEPHLDSPDALVLSATLRQHAHDFDGALVDLDHALAVRADDPQAWVTRAVVLQMQGRHREALASCDRAAPFTTELVAEACRAGSSRTPERYAALEQALRRTARASRSERAWALGNLGDLAAHLGDDVAAEAHYREGLSLDPDDAWLRRTLADFLRARGRTADASGAVERGER